MTDTDNEWTPMGWLKTKNFDLATCRSALITCDPNYPEFGVSLKIYRGEAGEGEITSDGIYDSIEVAKEIADRALEAEEKKE